VTQNFGYSHRKISALLAATTTFLSAYPGWSANTPAKPATTTVRKSVVPAISPQALPTILELAQSPQTLAQEQQLEKEGDNYFDRQEYDKALVKWQEAYGMSLEMNYGDGEGRCLTKMSRLYFERGQLVKAKELGENALELLASSNDTKSLAKARLAVAQAYLALDHPTVAAQQLDLVMKTFTDPGTEDAKEGAHVMIVIGGLLLKLGKFKESLGYYQAAATYYGRAGDRLNEVSTRIALANMMQELGWFTAAREEADKTVPIARASNSPELVGAALACQGSCLYNLGEYAAARTSYEEALLTVSQTTVRSKAHLQSGFGFTLAATGDLESAKTYLEGSLPGLKTDAGMVVNAQTLNALGNVEELLGHHARAIEVLNQALELQSICTPKQPKLGIIIMQNLAAAQVRSGDSRSAKNNLQSALLKAQHLRDSLQQARILSALAEVCVHQKDLPQAEAYLKQAIAISEPLNDDAVLWRNYTLLAQIQAASLPAQPNTESLNSAISYLRSPQAGNFSSPETLGYPTSREEMQHKLVLELVAAGMSEQALLVAEQAKEEAFISQWQHAGVQVKPEDREIYNDLVSQRAHLHASEAVTTPSKLLKDWKAWMGRFQQLSNENRPLARLIAPVPTTFDKITKELQATKTTIVNYLVGSRTSVVFVVDKAGKITVNTLPIGTAHLQPQVATLLNAPAKLDTQAQFAEKRALKLLYSELFPAAVESLLPADAEETVVIMPDGVLFNLPFAALQNAQGKHLIENHTLTMASSLGALLDVPTQQTGDLSLMVAAATTDGQPANFTYETEQIASLFQPESVTKLLGKEAEIGNLEEQAKGKTYLHFPSKLVFLEKYPLYSILPILPTSGGSEKRLTANRLFSLKLPSDLAVWSTTTVNSKDIRGNAVNTFSRGLGYAGVRNVLLSLWVEPDRERVAELIEI